MDTATRIEGVIGGGRPDALRGLLVDDDVLPRYAELDIPAEWADFRVPCPCCDGGGFVTLVQDAEYRKQHGLPLRSDQAYLEDRD